MADFGARVIGPGIWVIQEPIGQVAPGFDVTWVNMYWRAETPIWSVQHSVAKPLGPEMNATGSICKTRACPGLLISVRPSLMFRFGLGFLCAPVWHLHCGSRTLFGSFPGNFWFSTPFSQMPVDVEGNFSWNHVDEGATRPLKSLFLASEGALWHRSGEKRRFIDPIAPGFPKFTQNFPVYPEV